MSRSFNTVRAVEGHYNLCAPGETQIQLVFTLCDDAPEMRTCLIVSKEYEDDLDTSRPLAAAQSAFAIYKMRYLYNGNSRDAEKLIEYLRPYELRDELGAVQLEIEMTEKKLVRLRERKHELLEKWPKTEVNEQ